MSTVAAYPGPAGSHSHAAATRLAANGASIGLPTFSAVIAAAVGHDVSFGVLPIESSLTGPIAETHDLLYASPLSIIAETLMPISHCLLAPGLRTLEDVHTIRSHPAAFEQCRTLLDSMPWARRVAAATTADAAREVAESDDPRQAAIASAAAGHIFGLRVLAEDVGDDTGAYTRFVAIAPYTRVDREDVQWRTALTFVTDHQPGALHRALTPFADCGVNLVQLVSRPLPQSRWRYRFDAVLDGHPLDDNVRAALGELRAVTRKLRIFGSYAAGEEA
jgi:prephenate dehydratase